MLFLFNDVVFDLGDLTSVLRSGELPLTPTQVDELTAGQLNTLVREAVFMNPDVAKTRPRQVKHLVALITYVAPGANALLAVRPDDAETCANVGLRYAQLPITTLAYLWGEQEEGRLTPRAVNQSVWAA